MKAVLLIFLALFAVKAHSQDAMQISKKELFIDSIQKTGDLKIDVLYSTCFRHKKFMLSFSKKNEGCLIRLYIIDSFKFGKSKKTSVSTFFKQDAPQIDSVRKLEQYLNIFPTEDSDGQRYYFYTLSSGKKVKKYFDGIQADPWMRIEGLVKILFPRLKVEKY